MIEKIKNNSIKNNLMKKEEKYLKIFKYDINYTSVKSDASIKEDPVISGDAPGNGETGDSRHNAVYEDIFKEMLKIEKSRSIYIKFCLIKITLENIYKIKGIEKGRDENQIVQKFLNILLKFLRKKLIYSGPEPFSFLIVLSDVIAEGAIIAMDRVEVFCKKAFGISNIFKWKVLIGTNNEEELKPYLKNVKLLSEVNARPPDKVIQKTVSRPGFSSAFIFKRFFISYIIFGLVTSMMLVLLYSGVNRFLRSSNYQILNDNTDNLSSGLIGFLAEPNLASSPAIFFIVAGLILLFIFGIGLTAGLIIRLKNQ